MGELVQCIITGNRNNQTNYRDEENKRDLKSQTVRTEENIRLRYGGIIQRV